MPHYDNKHFGITLPFPDSWALYSWHGPPLKDEWKDLYQGFDGDVPPTLGEGKFLFTASKGSTDSRALVEEAVELSVYRQSPDCDMALELERSIGREGRSEVSRGTWKTGGLIWKYFDVNTGDSDQRAWHRFVVYRVDPKTWLYGKLSAYSPSGRDRVIAVFEKCRKA